MASPARPRSIAILQSNYIPWKGYLDIIASVDELVIMDDVQFTRRDWRNRNRIVVGGRLQWLTIPVASKGRYEAPISEIEIADPGWSARHWRTIVHGYSRAPHFADLSARLHPLYEQAAALRRLSQVNVLLLRALCDLMDLSTPFEEAASIPRHASTPTERLVEICLARGAREYVSGPAAKAYIDPAVFEAAGIALRYVRYEGYPVYAQRSISFEHGVSVVDLLAEVGRAARTHLRSLADRERFLSG